MPGVAPPPRPEITIPGDLTPRIRGVIAHRSDLVDDDDRTARLNVPVTSPARTIVDLGRFLSHSLHARVLNDAERRRLCTLDDVRECLERIGGRGRPGTVWLRILLGERAEGWHPGDSDLELRVLRRLLTAGTPRPAQQHQVVAGRHVYILDLAWPEPKVGVDVNGPVHLTPEAQAHDAVRRNRMTRAGWHMLEATPETDLDELARDVQDAIRTRLARQHRDLDERD
jgi:very-short-patch-repair endonuclease